mgnify:CR=1 FL=1
MVDKIEIKGAKVHNLKNIDVDFSKNMNSNKLQNF